MQGGKLNGKFNHGFPRMGSWRAARLVVSPGKAVPSTALPAVASAGMTKRGRSIDPTLFAKNAKGWGTHIVAARAKCRSLGCGRYAPSARDDKSDRFDATSC